MLHVADEVFERYPGVLIGTVVASGLDNTGERPDLAGELRSAELELRGRLAGSVLVEHERIAPWRDAYRAFGAKPKKYPSSIEAIARRVLKGGDMPSINPLVNLYNVVSMRHALPVGGEDLAALEGQLQLRFAGENEPEVELLGRPVAAAPLFGEVIYADDKGAVCRRWNWREAARTCLKGDTRDAILVVESLPPTSRSELEAALDDLFAAIQLYCGGRCERVIYG